MSKASEAATETQPSPSEADAGQPPALDFSQPTKFTPELRRRITRAFEPVCEALGARLSAELRATVQFTLADSNQLTWAAAKAQLAVDSIAVSLRAGGERQLLLCIESPMVLQALECLLGGRADQAPEQRRLSEIDWALNKYLLEAIVAQLSAAWQEMSETGLELGQVDMEGDAGVAAVTSEPTFLIVLRSDIDGLESTVSLLIPWSAVEGIAGEIAGTQEHATDSNPRESRAVRRGLQGARIVLRARIGSVQMPVEQTLTLSPGELLTLEGRAEDGVELLAEGVSVGRGKPGRSGARRAIKVISTIEPPARSKGHAQPVRSELERTNPSGGGAREGMAGLRSVPVEVTAELGHAYLPLGDTLELTQGSVIELLESAEEPIELLVNGLTFARGELVVSGEGQWGVQIDEVL
jgi:flagellar motor switch protein FliM